MGSKRFEGIRFYVWSRDHPPPHVHAIYAEVSLVIEFSPADPSNLRIRRNSIQPPNASESDVRHILTVAAEHFVEVVSLWEELHG